MNKDDLVGTILYDKDVDSCFLVLNRISPRNYDQCYTIMWEDYDTCPWGHDEILNDSSMVRISG